MVATNITIQERTYELWIDIHDLHDAFRQYTNAERDRAFQQEVATYGDVTQASTWERAFAVLKAKFLADAATDDGQFLIEYHLIEAPQREGWQSLTLDVVRQLLMIPDAIASLAKGWQKIQRYGCEYGADQRDVENLLKPFEEKLSLGQESRHYQRIGG